MVLLGSLFPISKYGVDLYFKILFGVILIYILLILVAGKKYGKTAITVNLIEDQEPCRKKAKLGSGDNVAEVTDSISSLTTAEQH